MYVDKRNCSQYYIYIYIFATVGLVRERMATNVFAD